MTNVTALVTEHNAAAAKNLDSELENALALAPEDDYRIWNAVRMCPAAVLKFLPDRLRSILDEWLKIETARHGEGWVRDVGMTLLGQQSFADTPDGLRLTAILEKINKANQGRNAGRTRGEEGKVRNDGSQRSQALNEDAPWRKDLDAATVELTDFMVDMRRQGRMPNIRIRGVLLVDYIAKAASEHRCNNEFAKTVLDHIGVPVDVPPFLLVFQYLDHLGIQTNNSASADAEDAWKTILRGPEVNPDTESDEDVDNNGSTYVNPYALLSGEEDQIEQLIREKVNRRRKD